MTREAAAFLSQKRHGWRSFLCTSGTTDNQWSDRTSTYILPEHSEIEEDFEDDEYLPENKTEKRRLISTTDDDGFDEEDKKGSV
uniref:Uncharacterized protein n=1 Tax=Panagrolaimus sp. JU765 TaxID=591449 RepID=A0AC34R5M4_9BILA